MYILYIQWISPRPKMQSTQEILCIWAFFMVTQFVIESDMEFLISLYRKQVLFNVAHLYLGTSLRRCNCFLRSCLPSTADHHYLAAGCRTSGSGAGLLNHKSPNIPARHPSFPSFRQQVGVLWSINLSLNYRGLSLMILSRKHFPCSLTMAIAKTFIKEQINKKR